MVDHVSGETVTYTYDSLNRMVAASSHIGQTADWGEEYTFDPFGNLYEKTVTAGSGPSMSVYVDSANNQIAGGYDANGNGLYNNATVYDVENHLSGAGWNNGAPAINYGYDAQGKRFFMWPAGAVDTYSNATYSVVAYSPSGQKLGCIRSPAATTRRPTSLLSRCAARLRRATSISADGGWRRWISWARSGTYFPWGEAKGTTNPQDTWSYATYWRDSVSGLDYANNRYYTNAYGRFMTPDPYTKSGRLKDPQSWNRYAYTRGDPINRVDPTGMDDGPSPYVCPVGTGETTEYVICFDVSVPAALLTAGSNGSPGAIATALLAALAAQSAIPWQNTHASLKTASTFIEEDAAAMASLPNCQERP